jgi:hypothetical protein
MEHPEFPESTFAYVAFRAPDAEPERFGRRIYSTPLNDLQEMRKSHAHMSKIERVKSPMLVARFELVNVESWELK